MANAASPQRHAASRTKTDHRGSGADPDLGVNSIRLIAAKGEVTAMSEASVGADAGPGLGHLGHDDPRHANPPSIRGSSHECGDEGEEVGINMPTAPAWEIACFKSPVIDSEYGVRAARLRSPTLGVCHQAAREGLWRRAPQAPGRDIPVCVHKLRGDSEGIQRRVPRVPACELSPEGPTVGTGSIPSRASRPVV
jgi:hypothetical protein